MLPGIYTDISNQAYHRGEGLSSSDLKLIARSPAHYKAAKGAEPRETDAMKLGTATHTLILEPERFESEYAAAPDGLDRRRKEGKEAWAELEASGKVILTSEDYNNVLGMGKAVSEHSMGSKLFNGGFAELSCYWEQPVSYGGINTKILCKARPDYTKQMPDGSYVIIDLKTTQDARGREFQRRAYDLGYHISAAHYVDGMTAVMGLPPKDFVFVVVESSPPYGVNLFRASEQFLAAGREDNGSYYKIYAACLADGAYPCYPEMIRDLQLPRWASN